MSRTNRAVAALLAATGLATAVAAAPLELEFLGRYESGVFDEGATEIVAHDPATQRLFVTNGDTGALDILSIADPTNPVLIDTIDLSAWGSGANSVASYDGVFAAAVEGEEVDSPGRVVFFDALGNYINDVEVGVLPDMVTYSPDGQWVLVANEAEPSDDYSIDPEGSISVIDVSAGEANVTQDDVRSADFADFSIDDLDPRIRIFGPGATVAQDLEPEYIAVSADSTTAWVTLQENNALAVVDIATAEVTAIVALGEKKHFHGTEQMEYYPLLDPPVLGTTVAGQDILLGGFSGLYFDGFNPDTGAMKFLAHPDRGPNADPLDVDSDGVNERPFPLPDYQARIVELELDTDGGELSIVNEIFLTRQDGVTPITGLPNILCTDPGFAYTDEEPVDVFGNDLDLDPLGADMEGVARTADGTLWMVDEYRPAIYHFTAEGVLIDRYVPVGSNCSGDWVGTEALPEVYAQRRANRGFEAVAAIGDNIYAFIQSPIDNPDVGNDANSKNSNNCRIIEFDAVTQTVTAEYLYVLDGSPSDKIGDAVAVREGEMLVVERDSAVGQNTLKNVYTINLDGATNLSTLDPSIVGPGGTLEGLDADGLADEGIVPVTKTLYADLGTSLYFFGDKPEGIALIDEGMLALVNDNDFQLAGDLDTDTGLVSIPATPQPTVLSLLTFAGNGLDTSDRDDAIAIENWPLYGMYMPDGIASFEFDGDTYLVTANEGDAREYDTFEEEVDVEDVDLDPTTFRNPEVLQQDETVGRLNVSLVNADADGDGDFDYLYSFGTRSISIWDAAGNLVWDSGDELAQIVAELYPDEFNSDNGENDSFDSRSDNKGVEPENVAVGTFGELTFVFAGLERMGGIVVYNITNPMNPEFVQYINSRDFEGDAEGGTAGDLGPEGIIVIDGADSPTGEPLLVVANEVSGTTAVFRIGLNDDCPGLVGDLNGDCQVTMADLQLLLESWGPCDGDCIGDINGDGIVDLGDLALLLANYGL
jgi:hypothetical protein